MSIDPKKLWRVPPAWAGETAYIIAGGPSVLQQDLRLLHGLRVIVVNSAYEAYPDADVLFFGDRRWFDIHYHKEAFRSFRGMVVTINDMPAPGMQLHYLRQIRPQKHGGFCTERNGVAGLRTNLQGAMNLAVHLGARRIVLLGADMRRADNGRSHHHTAHPWPNLPGDKTWDIQLRELRLIVEPLRERSIEVINTSMQSRIDWWPKMTLEDAVNRERRSRRRIEQQPAAGIAVEDHHQRRTRALLDHLKRASIGFTTMPHQRGM